MIKMANTQNKSIFLVKFSDWNNIAKKYYPNNKNEIEFQCPSCKHIQSVKSILNNNSKLSFNEIKNWVNTCCEGRFTKNQGCNWTLGGLLGIHNIEVQLEDGSIYPTFNFANNQIMKELRKLSIENTIDKKKKFLSSGSLWECFKEFSVESKTNKNNLIKSGEILEYRYSSPIHFRNIKDEYFHTNEGNFLSHCRLYGNIFKDIRFNNKSKLKEILEQNLYEKVYHGDLD